jgi:hypothetical protein
MRERRHRRLAKRVIIAGITLVAMTSPGAQASQFHRLAADATRFATDGTRYAAWEVLGHKAIFLLDTRSGRSFKVEDGCALETGEPNDANASAGRFLVSCPRAQALLNAKTHALTPLPYEEGPIQTGPQWKTVGLRYVRGEDLHAHCHRPRRHEGCAPASRFAQRTVAALNEQLRRYADGQNEAAA